MGEGKLPYTHSPTDFACLTVNLLVQTKTARHCSDRTLTVQPLTAFRVFSLTRLAVPLSSSAAPYFLTDLLGVLSLPDTPSPVNPQFHGDEGIRTPGILLAKQALSH